MPKNIFHDHKAKKMTRNPCKKAIRRFIRLKRSTIINCVTLRFKVGCLLWQMGLLK